MSFKTKEKFFKLMNNSVLWQSNKEKNKCYIS